jgi:hypothetical protein
MSRCSICCPMQIRVCHGRNRTRGLDFGRDEIWPFDTDTSRPAYQRRTAEIPLGRTAEVPDAFFNMMGQDMAQRDQDMSQRDGQHQHVRRGRCESGARTRSCHGASSTREGGCPKGEWRAGSKGRQLSCHLLFPLFFRKSSSQRFGTLPR